MKKFLIIVLAFTFSWAVAQKSETRSLPEFTGVKVMEGIDVYLKKGDKESVRIEVTGTDLANVITEVSGSYLKVHMREGRYHGKMEVKAYVTYVNVDKLAASSAGTIFAENTLAAGEIGISPSSAGSTEVTVEASRREATASSPGSIELKGKCKSMILDVASAGKIDAGDLQCDHVEAEASSGGSAQVNALKSIVARASSGGSVRYRGNPEKQNNSSSSGGSVRRSN